MEKDLPKIFCSQMNEECRDIEDHITLLEETARQHFENESKLLELKSQNRSKSGHLNMDYLLETHKKSHQELLEAIESIATEFRDHIRLEEWYQSRKL